jgi:sugar lactone lactonase YvrE
MNSIARFSANGKLDVLIEVPVLMPTMVAFGGSDMSTLYVTSARDEHIFSLYSGGRAPNDLDGDILAISTSFTGIPETKVRIAKTN